MDSQIESHNQAVNANAMLVRFTIKKWHDGKGDKILAAATATSVGGNAGRYSVSKALVDRNNGIVAAVRKSYNAVKTYFYDNTLVYSDSGWRILATDHFLEFSAEMAKLTREYENAVKIFLDNWADIKAEGIAALGSGFKSSDYPDDSELASKFSTDLKERAIPVGDHMDNILLKVGARQAAEIKEKADAEAKRDIESANKDGAERMAKQVGKLAKSLKDYSKGKDGKITGKYHDTVFTNVIEMAELLPKILIDKDPELIKILDQIKTDVGQVKPEETRKDDKVREDVAKTAQTMADKMAGFLEPKH